MWPYRQGLFAPQLRCATYPFLALNPKSALETLHAPYSQAQNMLPPGSKEPTKHSSFLLAVGSEKYNNLLKSMDS